MIRRNFLAFLSGLVGVEAVPAAVETLQPSGDYAPGIFYSQFDGEPHQTIRFMWYSRAVKNRTPPFSCDLPHALWQRLTCGSLDRGGRCYVTEAEALSDLANAQRR